MNSSKENKSSLHSPDDGPPTLTGGEDVFIQVSNLRKAVPQFIATMAQSLLLLSIGMLVASPTIVIGALHRSINGTHQVNVSSTKENVNGTQSSEHVETLFFTDAQAAWFGSILLLCQPVGSIASCFVQGYLGRRKSMILVNLPLILGWYLLYLGESVEMLFTSAIISGLAIGFMEAPTLAYIGEVSEPRLRGTFTSILNTHVCIGHLLEFLIGCAVGQENWRTAMLISIIVPVLTILIIYQIPESPVWLLSKGRKQEALESLCWLRGWVEEKAVEKEFQSFVKYNELSQRPVTRENDNNIYKQVPTKAYINANGAEVIPAESIHPPKKACILKLSDIFRPAFIRPLRLILMYMFFTHMASLNAIRPYMIETFGFLGLPIEPLRVTVMTASVQLAGGLSCIFLVHKLGKRFLSLVSMSCCSICIISIGIYTLYKDDINQSWIPLVLFAVMFYSLNLAVSPIPWMLVSEMFPQRGRGAGGGISAAFFYTGAFITSFTYIDLRNLLHPHGVFLLYGIMASIGVVFVYFCLPETEGRTLAEIETYFVKHRFLTTKKYCSPVQSRTLP
uniref:Facilitated trehalose transporter Tret1 n=1 Tax=Cacopsylla melanoneura TaxID=428564 RepID=A0A8D8W6D7_9HEMI